MPKAIPSEQFGKRLYREAWKRGGSRAAKKVVMGDRSEWIWHQAQLHFPGATQIADLYHAREPLWELASCTPMVRPSRTVG